jgi:hypothetical protein
VIYTCCDKLRRDAVAAHPPLNGIDYLEVIDGDLPAADPLRQRTLLVYCLRPVTGFTRGNVIITGGERVKNIAIEWAWPASPLPSELSQPGEADTAHVVSAVANPSSVLVVRVAEPGDYSTYTLSLARSATDFNPPKNFDPQLDSIDFSFKVECPSDFDCQPVHICPPQQPVTPDIDYLAKDYESFRRLMLDRMTQLAPQWQQTSVADFGIALVELLAYVGDQLSYQQDAVATEAYLQTARRRVSLRRHAVLVDYPMHDGCNARAWVQLQVAASGLTLTKAGTQFLTRRPGFGPGIASNSPDLDQAMLLAPTVYEPLEAPTLVAAHNAISLYTWGDKRCCLAKGATSATLTGHLDQLKAGDALLFEEVLGPDTGAPGDADATHRQVVRLTKADCTDPEDASAPRIDPLTGTAVTEIAWADEDALSFALCVSAVTDDAHGAKYLADVSIARGNLVLVDHGRTIAGESLGQVPAPILFQAPDRSADRCAPPAAVPIPPRYRPQLAQGPLTQAGTVLVRPAGGSHTAPLPFDPSAPAVEAMSWSMAEVLPQIALTGTLGPDSKSWQSHRTLLDSAPDATDFVVEVEDDGGTSLRFGDDEHGLRPQTDTAFAATYRIGNGGAGNVGAEAIAHFVASPADIAKVLGVRNPLAAAGGVDPESTASVRRNAPQAFRTQERAVTPADYAAVTERHSGIERAAATLRWTGSWYTVFITADPEAGVDAASLKAALPDFLDRYRMAGHDLEFNDPRFVSLEIDMHVCVAADYFRSDVKAALLAALSSRILPDGRRGLFYPDNFSFGETVYLSTVYAAAHAVPGVASVQVTKFQRQGTDDPTYLINGELPLGRLEIARLDNDPNFPEHGVLKLDLNGGK